MNKNKKLSEKALENIEGGTIDEYNYAYINRMPYYMVNGKKFFSLEDADKYIDDQNAKGKGEEITKDVVEKKLYRLERGWSLATTTGVYVEFI